MDVKLLVSRAGVGISQNAGQTITVDDDEGMRMIKAGQAEIVEKRETATKKTRAKKAVK